MPAPPPPPANRRSDRSTARSVDSTQQTCMYRACTGMYVSVILQFCNSASFYPSIHNSLPSRYPSSCTVPSQVTSQTAGFNDSRSGPLEPFGWLQGCTSRLQMAADTDYIMHMYMSIDVYVYVYVHIYIYIYMYIGRSYPKKYYLYSGTSTPPARSRRSRAGCPLLVLLVLLLLLLSMLQRCPVDSWRSRERDPGTFLL